MTYTNYTANNTKCLIYSSSYFKRRHQTTVYGVLATKFLYFGQILSVLCKVHIFLFRVIYLSLMMVSCCWVFR